MHRPPQSENLEISFSFRFFCVSFKEKMIGLKDLATLKYNFLA